MFKYLYSGSSSELRESGLVITEFYLEDQYILILQDADGEVCEIARTDFS